VKKSRNIFIVFMVILMVGFTSTSCTPKYGKGTWVEGESGEWVEGDSDNPDASGGTEDGDDTQNNPDGTGGSNSSQNGTGSNGSNSSKGGTGSNGTSGGGTTPATSSKPINNVQTKGKTFSILSELLPASASKDNTVFEKMFFERVAEVEKQFECKINIIRNIDPKAETFAAMVQSGKKVADVVEVELRFLPQLVGAGYLKPWNDVPGINPNDTKYTPSYTKMAKFGTKNWGLMFLVPPEVRYCIMMNKTLLKNSGVDADGIYGLIDAGTWDYETFAQYALKATNAGSGKYGVGGSPGDVAEMLLGANNARLVTLDGNAKATGTYTSSAVKQALNFYNRLVNTDKSLMINSTMSNANTFAPPDYSDQFVKGNIAFFMCESYLVNQLIRPTVKNFDYGMLTLPKGPNASDYCSPSGHARVFTVTSNNKGTDLEFTAKVFDALAVPPKGYSGDWWKDEVQLDYFQRSDTKSLNIYVKNLESAMYDVGLGIIELDKRFKDTTVMGPIFFHSGLNVDSAVNSILGSYDGMINDVFNK